MADRVHDLPSQQEWESIVTDLRDILEVVKEAAKQQIDSDLITKLEGINYYIDGQQSYTYPGEVMLWKYDLPLVLLLLLFSILSEPQHVKVLDTLPTEVTDKMLMYVSSVIKFKTLSTSDVENYRSRGIVPLLVTDLISAYLSLTPKLNLPTTINQLVGYLGPELTADLAIILPAVIASIIETTRYFNGAIGGGPERRATREMVKDVLTSGISAADASNVDADRVIDSILDYVTTYEPDTKVIDVQA